MVVRFKQMLIFSVLAFSTFGRPVLGLIFSPHFHSHLYYNLGMNESQEVFPLFYRLLKTLYHIFLLHSPTNHFFQKLFRNVPSLPPPHHFLQHRLLRLRRSPSSAVSFSFVVHSLPLAAVHQLPQPGHVLCCFRSRARPRKRCSPSAFPRPSGAASRFRIGLRPPCRF